jgi:hypothetical protein
MQPGVDDAEQAGEVGIAEVTLALDATTVV